MNGVAVYAAGWLRVATMAGGAAVHVGGVGLVELAEVAAGLGCSSVYVVELPPGVGFGSVDGRLEITGGTNAGDCWRAAVEVEGAGRVQLVYPAADQAGTAGPWDALSPAELSRTFAALEWLLGVPWAESVGRTAERLILDTHPRQRGGVMLDRSPETPEPAAAANLELPWGGWRREPTAAERSARWVHAFDANAQYLAAWQAAELGHGTPGHYNVVRRFDPKVAGLWRLASLPANHRPELPAPWTEGREWFTTPTVARMVEFCDGWEPEVAEAWIWPRRSRFLRSAAERLRDARAQALTEVTRSRAAIVAAETEAEGVEAATRRVVADATLAAVKAIYRVQTGRFNMGGRDSAWSRPDWGHTVRAVARVNLHRRLCSLGAAPFAIATDGLLFATDEPDPHRFALSIRLPLGDGLGTFKHEATSPAGPVWEAYAGRRGARPLFRAVADHAIEEVPA